MSFAAVFSALVLVCLLGFLICLCWRKVFVQSVQEPFDSSRLRLDEPEWLALARRREEIEQDPVLEQETRQVLLSNWRSMAQELKQRAATQPDRIKPQYAVWQHPSAVFFGGIVLSLALALLMVYMAGGIHADSMRWPNTGVSTPQVQTVDQAVLVKSGHPGDGTDLKTRLQALEEKLKTSPNDLEGWVLLSRTQAALTNYPGSAKSLQKALELSPQHPDLLADLADMKAMANGKNLLGEPEEYIQQALHSDPNHQKALALAASAAEQAGNQQLASSFWKKLGEVQQAQQIPSVPLAQIKVIVPSNIESLMQPESVLFVFIKAQAGPGMPLAAVRVPGASLKAGEQLVFVNANDFLEENGLSNLPQQLFVQARFASKGTPVPVSGDLQSEWVSVNKADLAQVLTLNLTSRP